jgi:hypothetical protein
MKLVTESAAALRMALSYLRQSAALWEGKDTEIEEAHAELDENLEDLLSVVEDESEEEECGVEPEEEEEEEEDDEEEQDEGLV